MKIYYAVLMILFSINAFCQSQLDSLKQNNPDTIVKKLPPKVDHAEPLYIDLMRDLGARKGEAEINVGFGLLVMGEWLWVSPIKLLKGN